MEILESIIKSLDKGEVKTFKLLSRRFKDNDNKYVQLFDYVREDKLNTEEIIELLGFKDNMNAYYRLRNRLQDLLCKTLAFMRYEQDSDTNVYTNLAMAKILLRKNMGSEALYLCQKAYKVAENIDNAEMMIHALSQIIHIKQDVLYEDANEQRKQRVILLQEEETLREIDDSIAQLSLELRKINFSSNYQDLNHTIDKVFNKLKIKGYIQHSKRMKLFVTHNVLHLLLQQRKFENARTYAEQQLNALIQDGVFSDANHEKKIVFLDLYTNILVYNNDLKAAYSANENLLEALHAFNDEYFEQYEFLYYKNLYVIHTADGKLEEYLPQFAAFYEKTSKQKNKFYNTHFELIAIINLIIGYFSFENYDATTPLFHKLYNHTGFNNLAEEYTFAIKVLESIILYETKQYKRCTELLQNIQQVHHNFLQKREAKSDVYFTQILQYLCQNGRTIQDKTITNLMRRCILKSNQVWPGSVIVYYKVWLHARFNNQNYHETFLEMIKGSALKAI